MAFACSSHQARRYTFTLLGTLLRQNSMKYATRMSSVQINGFSTHSQKNTAINGSGQMNGSETWLGSKWTSGDNFLRDVCIDKLIKTVLESTHSEDSKVINFVQPNKLNELLDVKLTDEPLNNQSLEELCRTYIKYSVKTGHKHFYNTLFIGTDPYALSAALINESLNAAGYTFEIAPCHALLEREVIEKFGLELVGYEQVDGIFSAGGSASNMNGISIARFHRFPESKSGGIKVLPNVHIYTSDCAHYSIQKAAFFMGFGTDSIVTVKTDEKGRMDINELNSCIQKSKKDGFVPFLVNATAGTTVYGAFDQFDEIANVCQQENVWMHIDACLGGAVLFTQNHKYKMKGSDRADSIAWNPHKLLGSVLQCSLLVTKHLNLLGPAHSADASYLFMKDRIYDTSYDSGDKSLQCGRKLDAFKIWLEWKAYGTRGLGVRVEKSLSNALYLRDIVQEHPSFILINQEPECSNVCFWYVPPSLQKREKTREWWNEMANVAPTIKGRMQTSGSVMVQCQAQNSMVSFFRMVCSHPMSTRDDMQFVVDEIERCGRDL